MAVDANAEPSRLEISRVLGSFLGKYPRLDNVAELCALLELERKSSLPPFALLRLITSWNSMAGDRGFLDTAEFINEMKSLHMKDALAMEKSIARTKCLKDVFTPEWFAGLRREIEKWTGTDPFATDIYSAYISDWELDNDETSFLHQIDRAFSQLATQTTRKRLARKLRDMPRQVDTFISTVYEVLVTAQFPRILDHEPQLNSRRVVEARVVLASQSALASVARDSIVLSMAV